MLIPTRNKYFSALILQFAAFIVSFDNLAIRCLVAHKKTARAGGLYLGHPFLNHN